MMSSNPKPVKVTEVNPHLICVLCGGYLVDATTIIECLHSFCKSCIVRYLETNKYCPICDVQVHKNKPLLNIRADRTLQAIVYKVVPGLFERELKSRKEFYKRQLQSISGSNVGQFKEDGPFFTPDESVLLGVQFANNSIAAKQVESKRYLRCPAAVTIRHLHRLMRAKFGLSDMQQVEFLHNGTTLPDHLSLMDLAFMYNWKRKHPVELEYRLLECYQKRIKLSHEVIKPVLNQTLTNSKPMECETIGRLSEQPAKQPDREVQLQISENGVMSVQSVALDSAVDSESFIAPKPPEEDKPVEPEKLPPASDAKPETVEPKKQLDQPKTFELEDSLSKDAKNNNIIPENKNSSLNVNLIQTKTAEKRLCELYSNFAAEKPNESKNNPINNTVSVSSTSSQPQNIPRMHFSNSLTIQKVYPGAVKDSTTSSKIFKSREVKPEVNRRDYGSKSSAEKPDSVKPKQSNCRYKTLQEPIKQWNPSIGRDTVMAMKQAQLAEQERIEGRPPAKAPKFFKMRNVPRFLGNPASGVKPMYQAAFNSDATSSSPSTQTSTSQHTSKPNSEVTVMKIDPKTLNPIQVALPQKVSKLNQPAKVPSPFVPVSTSQKPQSPVPSGRTSIRNPVPVTKSSIMCMKPTSQNHSAPSLTPNPFLLPSPHLMYSGFPRPFSPVDSTANRIPTDSQILQAMSMLCPPSAAFHPSLPPSISMLFNPHNPHNRTINEKMNLKYPPPTDFHKPLASTTPSIQRIPPSVSNSKHSPASSQPQFPAGSTSVSSPTKSDSPRSSSKTNPSETQIKTKELQPAARTHEDLKSHPNSTMPSKSTESNRLVGKDPLPLSNGFSEPPDKSHVERPDHLPKISKAEAGRLSSLTRNSNEGTFIEEKKAGQSDKSSVS